MAAGHLSIQKIKTTHNIADICPKGSKQRNIGTRTIGLRHVNAHSGQKELRLESIEHSHPMLACALSSDQVQQFSCDKPAKSQMVRYQEMRSESDVSYRMLSRRNEERVLVGRVLRIREGD